MGHHIATVAQTADLLGVLRFYPDNYSSFEIRRDIRKRRFTLTLFAKWFLDIRSY